MELVPGIQFRFNIGRASLSLRTLKEEKSYRYLKRWRKKKNIEKFNSNLWEKYSTNNEYKVTSFPSLKALMKFLALISYLMHNGKHISLEIKDKTKVHALTTFVQYCVRYSSQCSIARHKMLKRINWREVKLSLFANLLIAWKTLRNLQKN